VFSDLQVKVKYLRAPFIPLFFLLLLSPGWPHITKSNLPKHKNIHSLRYVLHTFLTVAPAFSTTTSTPSTYPESANMSGRIANDRPHLATSRLFAGYTWREEIERFNAKHNQAKENRRYHHNPGASTTPTMTPPTTAMMATTSMEPETPMMIPQQM